MTEHLTQAVRRYADAHPGADGFVPTPVAGVTLVRMDAPTGLIHAIYKPVLCLVLGGAKQVTIGDETHVFSAGRSVIVSGDVPVIGRVVRATKGDPYLAVAMDLDFGIVRDISTQMRSVAEPRSGQSSAMLFDDTDEAMLDSAHRLVRLLDRPDAAPVLGPALTREMHFWLLSGRHGPAIRRIASVDGHAERIARAVALLRSEFAGSVPIGRLLATTGMSSSSFHHHFRALTSMSPRQFQKRLRLLEARRLMLSDGLRAGRAAYAVGYESVSQFTRDYGRVFGAPPRTDVSGRKSVVRDESRGPSGPSQAAPASASP